MLKGNEKKKLRKFLHYLINTKCKEWKALIIYHHNADKKIPVFSYWEENDKEKKNGQTLCSFICFKFYD